MKGSQAHPILICLWRISRLKIRIFVVMLAVAIGVIKVPAQCSGNLDGFVYGSENERSERFNWLFNQKTRAIPVLIEQISNKSLLRNSLAWPGSSTLDLHDSYCGVLAAYLVELVLRMSSLSVPLDNNDFLGKDPSNYVYDQGRIVYSSDGRDIGAGDLHRLQIRYRQWWKANQTKAIQELREDWENGHRPLTNTEFAWK